MNLLFFSNEMFFSKILEGWLVHFSLAIITFITGLSIYVIYCFNYWKSKGVPYIEGKFPFGSISDFVLLRTSMTEFNWGLYKKAKGKKYVGYYSFFQPQLLVLDLEIIKNILIKDFSSFVDRGVYFNEELDPLSAHLFAIEGMRWKNLRAKLSPTFTSGKMKTMFPTMKGNSKDLQEYIFKNIQNSDTVNCKDISTRYGLDVIADIALGLKGNNFINDETDIKTMAEKFSSPSIIQSFRIGLALTCKNFAKFLKLRFTPKSVEDYFLKIVEQNINYRKKNNIRRNDFMQLLIDLNTDDNDISKTNSENHVSLSLKEMAAQTFVFVIAGFETTSATLSFCLYELALNKKIQKKLVEELHAVDSEMTYEILNKLPYLEMVLNETLRKYPVVPTLQRVLSRDYTLPDGQKIDKGVLMTIPVIGIQRDPDFFPDPDKFDPERFNEENVKNILPYTFMPFGEGPRICIGNRFAKMQIKLAIYAILSKFTVNKSEKTPKKIVPEKKTFVFNVEGGMHLRITERKNEGSVKTN